MKTEDVISILDVALGADESGNAAESLASWKDAGARLEVEARDGDRFDVVALPAGGSIQITPAIAAARALVALFDKARPRARTVGGPMVEYVIDKTLVDGLREIVSHAKAVGLRPIE